MRPVTTELPWPLHDSTATRHMTDEDLAELLGQCIRNNEGTGLTGLLLAIVLGGAGYLVGAHLDGQLDLRELIRSRRG